MKSKLTSIHLFTAAALLLSLSAALQAASWPLFRGSPQRAGKASEQAFPKLTAVWALHLQGEIISSPAVCKGIVYFGGRDLSVWAVDALTGDAVWQYSTGDWVDATPCVSTGTVYVPGRDKYFYAFDRIDGSMRWRTYTGSSDCSSPVLYGGKVYAVSGTPSRKLYCLDAASGLILHEYPLSQFGFSSPSVKGKLMFFGTNDGVFHCFDLEAGQMKWDLPTEGGIFYSSLAAADGAVYAVSGEDERRLFCLNPENGSPLWESAELSDKRISVSSPALGDDKVYVACSSGTALALYAFPLTGTTPVQPLWSVLIGQPHPTGIVSSPAVSNGVVYVGSGDGMLYCIDANTGEYINPQTGAVSASPVGYYLSYENSPSSGIVSSPAVSNGMVFAGTFDGSVYAFKAEKAAAISSPDNNDVVSRSADVTGSALNPAFSGYSLEYGAGSSPSSWSQIAAGTAAVDGGILGSWDASALADGGYTVRLTVNGAAANRAVNYVLVDNPPQAPSHLSAEDTPFDGGGSITLTWNKSGDDGLGDNDVTGYRVYKSTYDGGYAFLALLAAGTTSYIAADCAAQTTFYFAVAAVDQHNESVLSNSAYAFSVVDGVEIAPESGGTVSFTYNGAVTEVVIDPNTFSEKVWVGIRIPPGPPETGMQANSKDTKIVREFGITPAGAAFLKPVLIKIPYAPQEISGMTVENLRIYWWDAAKGLWRIVNTSDPHTEDGRVRAVIPHFSLYRIMEYIPGMEELLSDDKTYTYPNPAKGDRVYFKYYLGSKADVTVDVYNVAGELIAHLEKTGEPAGIASEIPWDIGSIASGVYVYRIEAKSSGGSRAIKKKMAVIH